MDKDACNRSRYVPGDTSGHYESWFLRANHAERPLAFWIRYTVFCPRGRPDDAVGELWAIHFDGETQRIAAAKQVVGIDACRFSPSGLDVQIGSARLDDRGGSGGAASGANALQWDLQYAGSEVPLLLLQEAFYERGFPKAKALVAAPNARFDGVLVVNGERIGIAGWVGSQNHNWGRKHTDSYAWGQVAGFDGAPDAFLECSTARLKVGPFWTPPMTVVVLRLDGREIRLNSLSQALRAEGSFGFPSWRFATRRDGVAVSASIHAPPSAFVGLAYANPPGGIKTCLNTKLATCELTIEEAGKPVRKLVSRHRAAFEILTDRQDHGVAVVA